MSVERATCRNCGQTLERVGPDDELLTSLGYPEGTAWRHQARPPYEGIHVGSRGCRAASYDRSGDWDDTLLRSWKARPA